MSFRAVAIFSCAWLLAQQPVVAQDDKKFDSILNSTSGSTLAPASVAGDQVKRKNATLTGKITDLTKTLVPPGAHLLLIKEGADHIRKEVDVASDGTFIIEDLEPGRWEVTVSAPDMLSHTNTIDLTSGEIRNMDVALEELEAEDVMRITGKRTLIHPEQIGSRTNVTHDIIYEYKSGNDLQQLIESTPGVMNDSFGNIIVRGEHNAVNYVLDDVILPEAAGVLQQTNFVTPRSLQSFAMDIGGYKASDGGGPLGAVARMKSLPVSAKPSYTLGQQIGGPMQGNIYYNASGAFSQDERSNLNKLRYETSGSFRGALLGLSPPVKSFKHDSRADINVLGKIEYQLTERDRFRLTLGLNHAWLQVPISRLSYSAGVRAHQYDAQDYLVASYKHTFKKFFDEANLHLVNAFYYEGYKSRNVFDPDPVINGDQPLISLTPGASRFNYVFSAQGNIIKTYRNTHRLEAGFLSELRPVTTNFSSLFYNNDPYNPDVPYGALISPFTGTTTGPQFINGIGKYKGFRYLQSAYFQDTWRPTTGILKRLTLDAGVRADVYHGVFGNTKSVAQTLLTIPGVPAFSTFPFETQKVTNAQASGRFGGSFVVTPNTVLRGSFSNLFMPPPVDVFSTPPDINTIVNGVFNGTVRPMQATRGCLVDTSIEQQIGPRFMTRTNLFYKKLTNFGDSGVIGNSPLYNRQTITGQEAYGVETRVELKPTRDGYGFNGFVSNTFQIALLRGQKGVNGGVYSQGEPLVEDKYPDHDRREAVTVAFGYNSRKNWWVLADYKFLSGLQDGRDPDLFGPHPARTPWLNIFGINGGYKAPESFSAKHPWMPDTVDARFENIFNNRLPTNLGSPFQGTRFLLPFRFLLGCSWHVGKQQYKLSQNPNSNQTKIAQAVSGKTLP
jgi:hypothetical protein